MTEAKTQLRAELRSKRKSILPPRKSNAEELSIQTLLPLAQEVKGLVLSYVSFGSEFPTQQLNEYLIVLENLVLPKVEGGELCLYLVPSYQCLTPGHSKILEPDPLQCIKIPEEQVSLAFIPGLGFDSEKHRIGYGKGHFDRLLPKLIHCETIGIGFKEQFVSEGLPKQDHDVALNQILLF
ncbi:MAG: 5-formyltetrahydrofolate cyclo-ligase [Waddliaceae bacterium]|nr:5-formyltetrahydrofolate cyclo-ligase [Waddliaceae bacterium]